MRKTLMCAQGSIYRTMPYDRELSPGVIAVFLSAIHAAWDLMSEADYTGEASTSIENRITEALVRFLNQIWKTGVVDGYNSGYFAKPSRGSKGSNFNFTRNDVEPDLFQGVLVGSRWCKEHDFGLVVECKPVDRTHSFRKDYCAEGLKRFVEGDYAWAMCSAVMIAYVRGHAATLAEKIKKLKVGRYAGNFWWLDEPHTVDAATGISVTAHPRNFVYPGCAHGPGVITIHHLWLKVCPISQSARASVKATKAAKETLELPGMNI